jgi:peroxiredoxin
MRFLVKHCRRLGVWRAFAAGLAAILLAGVLPAGAGIKQEGPVPPDKAPCQVCMIQGEGQGAEKVAAVSVYEGKTYTFCSEECKERFDEDPLAYLPIDQPRPAPNFAVRASTGMTVGLADYDGRWLLLDFWATTCEPCVKLMPELDKLAARYQDRGLSVLGISIKESAEKALVFAEKQDFGYDIAVDDPKAPTWASFHVRVLPTAFLINPDGQIVARWMGKWDHTDVESKLEAVLPS